MGKNRAIPKKVVPKKDSFESFPLPKRVLDKTRYVNSLVGKEDSVDYKEFPALVLEEDKVYNIKVPWGTAGCRFIGISGGHYLLQSIKGGWKTAFSSREVNMGFARSSIISIE